MHWDNRKVATRKLCVMRDFDFVVLGVSIGVLPYVCGDAAGPGDTDQERIYGLTV